MEMKARQVDSRVDKGLRETEKKLLTVEEGYLYQDTM